MDAAFFFSAIGIIQSTKAVYEYRKSYLKLGLTTSCLSPVL